MVPQAAAERFPRRACPRGPDRARAATEPDPLIADVVIAFMLDLREDASPSEAKHPRRRGHRAIATTTLRSSDIGDRSLDRARGRAQVRASRRETAH